MSWFRATISLVGFIIGSICNVLILVEIQKPIGILLLIGSVFGILLMNWSEE